MSTGAKKKKMDTNKNIKKKTNPRKEREKKEILHRGKKKKNGYGHKLSQKCIL